MKTARDLARSTSADAVTESSKPYRGRRLSWAEFYVLRPDLQPDNETTFKLEQRRSVLVPFAREEEAEMAKKKSTETSRIMKGAELEVEHLTEVTDLSPNQARGLLRKHGADWPKLKDEAEDLKEKK